MNITWRLTEVEVRTVSYGPSFLPFISLGLQINGGKRDRENEVSKIFITSLRLLVRAGKEQLSNFAGRTVMHDPLN